MSETIVYTVPGIHCGHTASAQSKTSFKAVVGVRAVEVDLEAKPA